MNGWRSLSRATSHRPKGDVAPARGGRRSNPGYIYVCVCAFPGARLLGVQLPQFLRRDVRGQRKIVAVEPHQRLTFAAQNETKKFTDFRIEIFARLPVDVEPDRTGERIGAIGDVFRRGLDEWSALLEADRHELDPGIPKASSGERDAVLVVGQRVDCALPRVDVLGARHGEIVEVAQVAIPKQASLHHLLREKEGGG